MQTLSESSRLRFLLFTALYFAQGLPWGFISVGYVVFLTDQGLDNTAIGSALGLAYIPWSFKILAGPLLDGLPVSRWGRRRPFIIGAELLMGLTLLLLLVIDPATQLWWVGVILFLHNSAAAVQDVAVDALAVELLRDDERGRANSLMWAGKSAGVALGGGGGTVLAKYLGWPSLFIVLALAMWAVMALPILFRERPLGAPQPEVARLDRALLKRSFGFWAPWGGLLVALVTPVGYAMVGPVYTRLLRADLLLSEEKIALLTGVFDPIAGVVGALIGGVIADRYGARRAMGGAMLGIGACLAGFGLLSTWWPSLGFLIAYTIVLNLLINAYNAASLGFFMGLSNPAIGATQFAAFMAMTNLTYAWTSPLGGWVADAHGVIPLFLVAATAQVAAVAILPLVDPSAATARYRAVGAVPVIERAPAG